MNKIEHYIIIILIILLIGQIFISYKEMNNKIDTIMSRIDNGFTITVE